MDERPIPSCLALPSLVVSPAFVEINVQPGLAARDRLASTWVDVKLPKWQFVIMVVPIV